MTPNQHEWNRLYVLFAEAHGCTPEEQLVHDHARWPGGCMTGFVLWVSAQKRANKKAP